MVKKRMKMAGLNRTVALIILIIFLITSLVLASVLISKSQSDFNSGTYNNTVYNTTASAVQLNLSYNNGTYTSQIFNTGSNVSLNNLSWTYQRIQCPQNMSYINKLNGYCIDQYEASMPSANSTTIGNSSDVARINAPGTMMAVSQPEVVPWVSVSANSARTACINAGKHLCLDEEWLAAANIKGVLYNLPTGATSSANYIPAGSNTSNACVTNSEVDCDAHSYSSGNACNTGSHVNCTSAEGVYDMTGNVWEWTNETVGYTGPGASNWYYWNGTSWLASTSTATAKYGNDGTYFLGGANTGYAVTRGGNWDYGATAGPFCANLNDLPTVTHFTIGFRCCIS